MSEKTVDFLDGIYPNDQKYIIRDVGGANPEDKEIVFNPGTATQEATPLSSENLNILSDGLVIKGNFGGVANVYTFTVENLQAYTIDFMFSAYPNVANTGASTINVNNGTTNLGAKNIMKVSATALVALEANDLHPNRPAVLQYKPGDDVFVLLDPQVDTASLAAQIAAVDAKAITNANDITGLENRELKQTTSTGQNTYAVAASGVTSYTTDLKLLVNFSTANTGASTLNVNDLGARSIKNGTAQVVANELFGIQLVVYDGVDFQIVGKESASAAWAKINQAANPVTSDNAVSFGQNTVSFTEKQNTPSSATISIDWRDGNKQQVTLNQNLTIDFINPADSCNIQLTIDIDSTGGYTLAFGSFNKSGADITVDTVANRSYIMSMYYDKPANEYVCFNAVEKLAGVTWSGA